MASATTLTNWDAALKQYYRPKAVDDLVYQSHPLMELIPKDTKLYYDFSNVDKDIVYDLSGNGNHGILNGCYVETEPIEKIKNTTLPFRNRAGRFFSQDHKRNDMVGGKWVHQKDTSINERRFVEEVQGGIIDTDEDGLTDLNYSVVKREKLFDTEHEIIDFKCEQEIPNHVEY